MKHLGDIKQLNGSNIPLVDCITGGSPCQDLSVAGKRSGLSGERSGLFMEQVRIVREMRELDKSRGRTGHLVRPRFMVWENVPGAFSSGATKGADFAAVIEEIIKICEPGADVRISVPEKGWPKSGCYYADDGSWSVAWRVHDAQFWGVPQRRKRIALVADFGGLSAPEVLFERKGLRRDTDEGEPAGKEAARGTGTGAGGTSWCIKGNAIDRDTAQNGQWANEDVAEQANTLDTMHDQQAIIAFAQNSRNEVRLQGRDGQIAGAIASNEGMKQRTYLAYGLDSNKNGYQEQAGAIQAHARGGAEMCCDHQMTVRRLTPLECERLQGYPDGWTGIGDWTDSNGKKRHTSDTARYKALGNSIALPFWFWLLRRISAQYEHPATLGSLFDGIGGFPLCWERCNGKGTAVWASEIEEFPIAVTKRRFGDD